jgi:PKD repeat protein
MLKQTCFKKVEFYSVILLLVIIAGFASCEKDEQIIPDPAADFTYQLVDGSARSVQFTNTSIHAITYSWDFGDGTPVSDEKSPKHDFKKGGDYSVTLTATGENGTTSNTKTIKITLEYIFVNHEHGSNLIGVSTSSFSDANLEISSFQNFKPHFMRYYFGGTIVFDATTPPKGIASVKTSAYRRNGELTGQMAANMSDWNYTPALDFDKFINLCRANGAEPVVLLPVYAAYSSTPGPKMTRNELYAAHKAFVTYANITKGYGVKYWEIGNEDDLDPDNTSAATYAEVFNELVPLLKSIDPTIECGANTFWDTSRWKSLLPKIKQNMGFAVIHQYSTMQTYSDFLNKDMINWNGHSEIMIENFLTARKNLNDQSIPSKVIVTEISSHCTYAPANPKNNCVWKGLHNIQLLLQYGSYANVIGTMNWVTWYLGGLENTFNVFSGADETTLSPVGLTLQVLNDHLYPLVDKKTKVNSNEVEITISHSVDFSRMSVFILNKSKSMQTVSLSIPDFTGNPANNTKWVYQPATIDEWSQKVTYQQSSSTDLSAVTGISTDVPALSCTVYDFN